MGKGRGRPGGNPDFGSKIKADQLGEEKLEKFIGVRVTAAVGEKLDKLGDRKLAFIRDAIDKALSDSDLD